MKYILTIVNIVLFTATLFISVPKAQYPSVSTITSENMAFRLFARTNQERETKLKWDNCLAEKAVLRSKDMVENNYFDHIKDGKHLAWNLIRECLDYHYAGENLTKDFPNPDKAHQALFDSPTHKKNILNGNFTLMGVGCWENICTELFASQFTNL